MTPTEQSTFDTKLDEALDWEQRLLIREAVLQATGDTKQLNITQEMIDEAKAKAKQAITSLIKELVAEAKPSGWAKNTDDPEWQGYVSGINEFEQNLLKALENKV